MSIVGSSSSEENRLLAAENDRVRKAIAIAQLAISDAREQGFSGADAAIADMNSALHALPESPIDEWLDLKFRQLLGYITSLFRRS